MNELVKILRDDDGHETGDNSWHLVDPANDTGEAAFCTQEFFGAGESSKMPTADGIGTEDCVKFERKSVARGGITCPNCLRKLKEYKAVKL